MADIEKSIEKAIEIFEIMREARKEWYLKRAKLCSLRDIAMHEEYMKRCDWAISELKFIRED